MAAATDGETRFHRADSVSEACELLAEQDGVLIAGGQSLMPLLRQGLIDRDLIVDISAIEAHREIEVTDRSLTLGGLATHRDLIEAGLDGTPFEELHSTAKVIGDEQIRNWGTIGGSVAHGDPSSDYPPVLDAMDAEVVYTDGESESTVPIEEFYMGHYTTVLAPHEIVTAVRVPTLPERTGVAFEKFAWRKGDMALVNVAARLTADEGGTVTEARLCVGAMGPVPLRLTELESELEGEAASDAVHREAVVERLPEFTEPVSEAHASIEYKNTVAENLAAKALERAAEDALEGDR